MALIQPIIPAITNITGPEILTDPTRGLGLLSKLEQLVITQINGFFYLNNNFSITDAAGFQHFFAEDDRTFLCRGKEHAYNVNIYENGGVPAMSLTHDFKCCAGARYWGACCGCCEDEATIEAPIGTPIGFVRRLSYRDFEIYDENHQLLFTIAGPGSLIFGRGDSLNDFIVYTADGSTHVATFTKFIAGFFDNLCNGTRNNLTLTFPTELPQKTKAILLGAAFFMIKHLFTNRFEFFTWSRS